MSSLIWFVTGALLALVVGWVMMSAWRVEAAPGDTDTTVVPITACRLVDTRPATRIGPRNTALGAEQTYTVDVQDVSTQCAGMVPASASGLVLNVTAAQTSQRTFVTVWDSGPWPGTSSMNPVPGPPVPNAVTTKLSEANTFEVYNNAGSTHLIIDVVAYLTPSSLSEFNDRIEALETAGINQEVLDRIEALETANAALESQVSAVQATTAPMSTLTIDGHPTVRFEGVNVQIVDGTGDTDGDVNGLGNLIIGYNHDPDDAETRSGSHNLIVGDDHDYTSYGGAVLGVANSITAPYATVTGGWFNTASDFVASVSGGKGNTASGPASSVSGGASNTASGPASSVSGGSRNTASDSDASVSGGTSNEASGSSASVSGGYDNTASGPRSSVSGGVRNTASANLASVSGGYDNTASGGWSSVSGGTSNEASGSYASVSGGFINEASGSHASVSGGSSNEASDSYASVSGGYDNTASGGWSSVSGGEENTASGDSASVSGGSSNEASGHSASVSGGAHRTATGGSDWRAGNLFEEF